MRWKDTRADVTQDCRCGFHKEFHDVSDLPRSCETEKNHISCNFVSCNIKQLSNFQFKNYDWMSIVMTDFPPWLSIDPPHKSTSTLISARVLLRDFIKSPAWECSWFCRGFKASQCHDSDKTEGQRPYARLPEAFWFHDLPRLRSSVHSCVFFSAQRRTCLWGYHAQQVNYQNIVCISVVKRKWGAVEATIEVQISFHSNEVSALCKLLCRLCFIDICGTVIGGY